MEVLLNNMDNSDTQISKSINDVSEKSPANLSNTDLTDSNLDSLGNLDEKFINNETTNMNGTKPANSEPMEETKNDATMSQDLHVNKDSDDIITKTKKKRFAVIHSDSESEEPTKTDETELGKEEKNETHIRGKITPETSPKSLKKSKWASLCDSDSSDNEAIEPNDCNRSKSQKSRIKNNFDTDLEYEEQAENQINEKETYVIGSKGELILETPSNSANKSKWSALCDSESSEDELTQEDGEETRNEMSGIDEDQEENIKPTTYKRKPRSKGAKDEPKKMTGKDALKLRKEIESESQRMLRETKVSLPYHKPKQFTLKEFLSRRPKLSSSVTLPSKLSPSLALKMPKEQLEVISKKLAEREKEVKEFYKSDSGSDNDDADDPEYLPEGEITVPEKTSNPLDKETEDIENKTEEIANNVEEHVYKEGTNKEIEEAVSNKDSELNARKTTNSNVDNYCNSENMPDPGVNIPEGCQDVTRNDTNISEKQTESLNLNVDLQVGTNISENEQIEFDSGVEIRDVISEEMEIECSSVLESHEGQIELGVTQKSTVSEVVNRFSEDYEFSLDDLEESEGLKVPFETEESGETNNGTADITGSKENSRDVLNPQANKDVFKNDDLDKEIEAFNVESTHVKTDVKISDLLKEKLGNIMPRLSGTPDDVIDLEFGVAKPTEIVTLMERFEKHTAKKQVHKSKVHLNIVSVQSQGNIEKEVVSMEIDDEHSPEVEEKPGARLKRLRDELQNQIAKKKSEMWQNKSSKSTEKTTEEQENEDEPSKSDYEDTVDDILDDEDEEEMSESSEEDELDSEDEEKEESSKKKKTSDFIDEEAEESDIEDEEIEKNSDKENDRIKEDIINENSESTNISENEELAELIRKPLKRILKGFTEDSDDENDIIVPEETDNREKNEDDDIITPHQIMSTQTPVKENSQQTQNSFGFDFLTPVSYITGIKNLTNSAAKSVKESSAISPFPLLSNRNLPSPLKETDWQSSLQRKLFEDSEVPDSQAIADVCSGEFPSTQSVTQQNEKEASETQPRGLDKSVSENSEQFPSPVPTTQDLLNICSGKFTGTTQLNENTEEEESSATDIHGKLLEADQIDKRKSSEIDDVIISQLLDEEEMEKFKKKFESPRISYSQKKVQESNEGVNEVSVSGILDSDDDEDMKVTRRKNKAKLTFSDDESSEEDGENEEEIDLHDEDDDHDIENIPEPGNVEYDSEENEIEFEKNADEEETVPLKPSDFFDEEAELSESEWGSADEDEKDLDTLENEMGDTEKFDEKQLRRDLEKIHMRRMLDEDQREVKLLQELYLEDGELHGTGRQRQFKWKNIDTFDGEETPNAAEDDVYLDEEESEEQWRKKRFEREQFLKEKHKSLKSNESSDLLSNSQIVKIGHKVLQRSTSSNVSLPNTPNDNEEEVVTKTVMSSLIFSNKRGSFLRRGEDVLQKIAEFNRVTDTVVSGATAKNSRRFLFQTVTAEDSPFTGVKDKKRKASDGTPKVIKKLRLSDNLSPANRKKKLVEPKAKAKLF